MKYTHGIMMHHKYCDVRTSIVLSCDRYLSSCQSVCEQRSILEQLSIDFHEMWRMGKWVACGSGKS